MFYLIFNCITVVCLLVLFVLIFRKGERINKVLAFIILVPCVNFINNVFILSGSIDRFPHIIFICALTASTYAPLIFWYCQLFMGKKFQWNFPLHFLSIAFVLVIVYYWKNFVDLSIQEKFDFYNGLNSAKYPLAIMVINKFFTYLQLIYMLLALINVLQFSSRTKDFFSNVERIKLNYLVTFVSFSVGLTVLLGILYEVLPTRDVEFFYIPFVTQMAFLFVIVFAFQNNAVLSVADYSNLKKNLFSFQQYQVSYGFNDIKNKKIHDLFLPDNDYDKLFIHIKEKLEKEKIYKECNLSIATLAEKTGCSVYSISSVIKHKFGANFFDLINSYRLNDVLQGLEMFNNDLDTIETLAYKAGFNSKTAFYRAFKKKMKMTPKQFISKIKQRA